MRDTTTTGQVARMLELFDQGHGYAAIGRIVNKSPQLVGYYVRQHRTPRPPGHPPTLLMLALRVSLPTQPTAHREPKPAHSSANRPTHH